MLNARCATSRHVPVHRTPLCSRTNKARRPFGGDLSARARRLRFRSRLPSFAPHTSQRRHRSRQGTGSRAGTRGSVSRAPLQEADFPAVSARMSALPAKIVALHKALERAHLPHAFGGALALAWCTQRARGTIDIDVNIFVSPEHSEAVFGALPVGVKHTAKVSRHDPTRGPGPALVGTDSDRPLPEYHALSRRGGTAYALGEVFEQADSVSFMRRHRCVQSVLQSHEGLGRPRGDVRGGHAGYHRSRCRPGRIPRCGRLARRTIAGDRTNVTNCRTRVRPLVCT